MPSELAIYAESIALDVLQVDDVVPARDLAAASKQLRRGLIASLFLRFSLAQHERG